MNVQINEEQLNVVNEMIVLQNLPISAEFVIQELINNSILDLDRVLENLKKLKSDQEKLIDRRKFYIVK